MAKARILIIDTDARLVQSLRENLLRYSYEVDAIDSFPSADLLQQLNTRHLVVLDAAGPSVAVEQLTAIRAVSQLPVVVTTPVIDGLDRVVCLEAGADDCLLKPYESREMVARIHSILRRLPNRDSVMDLSAREWRFKGLVVQSNRRRILLDGQTVELTTAEFDLLKLLVVNAHQPLSREMILDQLRGVEWEAVDRSVDILISRLRDKLRDDPRRPRFVRTVRSVGYQFVGEPDTARVASSQPSTAADTSAVG